ncbi:HutD family protein [Trinickia fusca]|uniref:HutD family protein n=2 Tax=Trinickia fusca TaxID=2419777 RepID=A0A494XQ88_9BURK|nr:HutD family protein [Trinickia fusca]
MPAAAQPGQARAARTAITLMRASELAAVPWKNGGGVTREVAAHPPQAGFDTFDWRVSVADVAQPGPFSRFAGIDRTLVLLEGAGMRLVDERGATHVLSEPFAVAHFAGEASIDAALVDGPTRDFNLMLRRARASATLEVWRGAGVHTLDADVALVFCAHGTLAVTLAVAVAAGEGEAPVELASMDTLRIDAPRALTCAIDGTGTALAIRIRYL